MKIYEGDCLKRLKKLHKLGRQYDACVCDPPYHIESIIKRFGKTESKNNSKGFSQFGRLYKNFVGKTWDDGDIAFDSETWKLIFAVLKPGGYLAAFGFDKNSHKLSTAIENAGFEIRRTAIWLYSTSFPKSHNVGKHYNKKTGSSKFDGYGTDIRTMYEPIIIARKPFKGSVADNLIKNNTGALNVKECNFDDGRSPGNVLIDSRSAKSVLSDQAKFYYCPKPSKKEKNSSGINTHPTVKPIELMRWIVRLVTPPNGKIIDPFMGSGTTGIAAILEGKKFIGIERDPEYVKIAKLRIQLVVKSIG